ncbi:MAG: DUF3575 domain-containing protein [Bacteroidota bacterium]
MKRISKTVLLIGLLLLPIISILAQQKAPPSPKKNLVKVNLTSLPLNNYNGQLERVLGKKISIALSYRFMPLGNVPLKDNIVNIANGDANMQKTFDQFLISNNALTPELRWYPGKRGYGKGFYIAPFIRFANFNGEGIKIEFTPVNGVKDNISLSGDVKSTTYGLMLGAQWFLGKRLCLDWQIIGPHYGRGTGTLRGISSFTLSKSEQDAIRDATKNVEIPMTTVSSEVGSNSLKLSLDGPWAGIRAGISLGFRF